MNNRKTWLVTGCSTGFGRYIAEHLLNAARASSLPHVFRSARAFYVRWKSLWERACSRWRQVRW
ncbi:hypothetical protein [Pseudomonas sp. Z3-8]|uniref:hypothetical protein n=1 Tax=Pseudomonas sp. Z3-8 TaxID=2817412 RepID=UPI003DA978B3